MYHVSTNNFVGLLQLFIERKIFQYRKLVKHVATELLYYDMMLYSDIVHMIIL